MIGAIVGGVKLLKNISKLNPLKKEEDLIEREISGNFLQRIWRPIAGIGISFFFMVVMFHHFILVAYWGYEPYVDKDYLIHIMGVFLIGSHAIRGYEKGKRREHKLKMKEDKEEYKRNKKEKRKGRKK